MASTPETRARVLSDYHAAQSALAAQTRDCLAEMVANGLTISAAAKALGVSQQRASQHWARIKRDLGSQAR